MKFYDIHRDQLIQARITGQVQARKNGTKYWISLFQNKKKKKGTEQKRISILPRSCDILKIGRKWSGQLLSYCCEWSGRIRGKVL